MAGTILRMGWTDPRTDAFGAHPLLGPVFDLNDGVTFTLLDDTLDLEPPTRELALAGNPRTQGERATRALYRHNRQARALFTLGPMASYSDLAANVRQLVRWLDAAPATPFCVQWQPPSATQPVYLDVVGAAHGIPADEREWLRLQFEPIEIVLLVRPGLRGDRITLQNLVVNPGFEAGSGPGVQVFNDPFVNANAYTVQGGSAPTVASNVMTIPSGTRISFGSPAWGALNTWQVRFQFATGLVGSFFLHFTDGNNWLRVDVGSAATALLHNVAGTGHTLATGTYTALTNGAWYWLRVTQYPAAPGTQCDVETQLFADSGGVAGAAIAGSHLGPVATYDGVTALSGAPNILAGGAALALGGAFASVHAVSLFGPGGWLCNGSNGGTGAVAGAWEQSTSATYGGGAVTSFGAARMDLPPAGSVNAYWAPYVGGAPAGTFALPVAAAGDTLAAAAWCKTSGLSSVATLVLQVAEYTASGSQLRITTLQTLTGNQASWTKLSGTVTTGASCAYATLVLLVADATAGSAGGVVWWDNVQCWDATTTGVAAGAMPYCELRFGQSPAQLVVTGLLGDLPAPALLAWGTFLASWPVGSTLSVALGRRGQGQAASAASGEGANGGSAANARLVGASHGFYGTALSPTATAALDASSYGGYAVSASVGSGGWNPRAFSCAASDLLGVYHLLCRFQTNQASGNLPNVSVRVVTQQKQNAWYGTLGDADLLGSSYGPYTAPLAAANTWTPCDAGQVNVPALPAGALSDLTQNALTPRPQWVDSTGGGSTGKVNWQALLPIDGSLLMGVVNNPSNGAFGITNGWLWGYHDGLALNRAGVGDAAAATWSQETSALPNVGHGGGGPGTQTTGAININSAADAALTLDPTLSVAAVSPAGSSTTTAAGGVGVNQLAGYVADGAGTVLPLHVELQYSPLYLYPR